MFRNTLAIALSFILKETWACRGCFLFMNPNSSCLTPQHHAVVASVFMSNKSGLYNLFILVLSFYNSGYSFLIRSASVLSLLANTII